MNNSWDLSLSIDAHGHDDTLVTVVPGTGSSSPHLKVRVGLVVVHCLDGASAMSAARAWAAAAHFAVTDWQAPLREARRRVAPPGSGSAYPVGSILFEGRQPWHLDRAGHALAVTVGPLQVRAHDATALETHVRAWAEAAAVATRLFPGRAWPFARLLEAECRERLRAVDEPIDRRSRRSQLRPPGPTPPNRGDGGRPGPDTPGSSS